MDASPECGDGQMVYFSYNGEIYQYQQRTGKITSITSGFDPAIARRDDNQIAFGKCTVSSQRFCPELNSGKQSLSRPPQQTAALDWP